MMIPGWGAGPSRARWFAWLVPAWLLVSTVLAACVARPAADAGTGRGDSPCLQQAPKPPAEAFETRVRRVVDGDTFVAADRTRVRLLGINAPESADPRRPVERYGKEASAFARRLLQGKRVRIQPGRNPRDEYGRTLAWVWLEDGRFVNGELVRLGYAQVYTHADNPDFAAYLLQCQREARAAGRGLWGR